MFTILFFFKFYKQDATKPKYNHKLTPIKNFNCDICGYSSTFKASMNCHMNTRHVSEESKCQLCKKVFKNETRMKDHLRKTHKKTGKVGDFDCLICKALLNCYVSLRGHVEKFHQKDKTKITFICDLCGIEYYSKPYLDHHMKIEHSRPFKCFDAKCSKRFVNVTNRRSHHLTFHSRDLEVKFNFFSFPFEYECNFNGY